MNTYTLITVLFKKFPLKTILNISVFMAAGLLEMLSAFALVPIIEVLLGSDMGNISKITEKWIALMGLFNILPTKLNFVIVLLSSIFVASALVIYARYLTLRTKYAIEKELIKEALSSFFNASWSFFTGEKKGTLINTFNREMLTVGNSLTTIGDLFSGAIRLIFYAIVPFYISWNATSVAIGLGLIFTLPFMMLSRVSYRLGQKNTSTANRFNQNIQESFDAAKVILGYGNQHKNIIQTEESFDDHCKVTVKSQMIPFITTKGLEPFAWVSIIFTIYYSITYLNIPIAEVGVIVYALFRIFPLIAQISRGRNTLSNFVPSYEQIDFLIKRAKQNVQRTGELLFKQFNDSIVFNRIHFAYENRVQVLKNINVVIKKGNMTAFVGESGAGKSTLIDLLVGFYEPCEGAITIDGTPLFEYDIRSFRHRIGFVPQDSILFNTTIRNNLLWSYDRATENDLIESCMLANAHDFIMKLPCGYDTLVGDRGVRLSGGQRQRIALARAMLRKPELLILDEATSSLDSQSELLIQEAIEKIVQQTTVVVIAHRLSTITKSDWIYVLEDGNLKEEGSYLELINKGGAFYQMAGLQSLVV